MATYSETRKAVSIHSLLGGTEIGTAVDRDGNKAGSMALADFKAGRDIVVKGENGTTIYPYRSIQYLRVEEVSGEMVKDPYGCSIIVSFVDSDAGQAGFPPVEANADGQITLPGGDEQTKPIFYADEELSTRVGVGGDVITVTESTTLYYAYPMG